MNKSSDSPHILIYVVNITKTFEKACKFQKPCCCYDFINMFCFMKTPWQKKKSELTSKG